MDFSALLQAAFFSPDRLSGPSAWLGHLPFASWVVRQVQPRVFVELGTQFGHSYFAFCKAVAEAGLPTRCHAVDTWQGDDHAGRYGEAVHAVVQAHNAQRYDSFSTLLRMTFDEALAHFPDATVGLLHIDGLHSYEAVRHDFETWLPKLAPGAVVLFHDTSVRKPGFGVWQYWQELQKAYPHHLEFSHAYGLGVLQLTGQPGVAPLPWLCAGSADRQLVLDYFQALGSWRHHRQALRNPAHQAVCLLQALWGVSRALLRRGARARA